MKSGFNIFRVKIIAPAVLSIVLYILSFYLLIIPLIEKNNINRKKEMIVELTNSVVSIVHEFYLQSQQDTAITEDLKRKALQTVEYMQYGVEDKGYFWVLDTNAVLLCHPHMKEYVGKAPASLKHEVSNVLYTIVETVRETGKGFFTYKWQNVPFEHKMMHKLAYVEKYDNWNWIIGAGIYLDDLYSEINEIKMKLSIISGIIAFIIIMIITFILKQSLKVEKEKHEYHKELMATMTKFKALFESASDSLIILDSNLIIIDCNKKTVELRGLEKHEIIGRSPLDFVASNQEEGKSPDELAREMIDNTQGNKSISYEWKIKSNDGAYRYSLVTLSRFNTQQDQYYLLIIRDITDRKTMEKELLFATIHTEETERSRFASELHEGVGPIFSTVKLYFQWLSENLDSDKKQEIVEMGNKNIEEAIKTIKQISYNLSPHILANFGIVTAINEFIKNISQTGNIKYNFDTNLVARINKNIELTIYRVVTELINNTVKYAGADTVDITLMYNETTKRLQVGYADNGIGFNVKETVGQHKGLGLVNIQSRIKTLGGDIAYKSSPGNGVNVRISIYLVELNAT